MKNEQEIKELAEKAKAVRARTGLTQKAFAEKYGIPQRTIEGWESGRTPPAYVLDLLQKVIDMEDEEGGGFYAKTGAKNFHGDGLPLGRGRIVPER